MEQQYLWQLSPPKMISKIKHQNDSVGNAAEKAAMTYLKKQGLKLIEKNFRCRFGEIDLVVEDNGTLVFVEVRYRKNDYYGSAIESVTLPKRDKITITAQQYLMKHNIGDDKPIRFDVIGISPTDIQWIKNAF